MDTPLHISALEGGRWHLSSFLLPLLLAIISFVITNHVLPVSQTKEIDALQAQIKAEMADIQKTQASLMKRNAQYYGHTPIEQLLDVCPR